jgi:hypothetical protein
MADREGGGRRDGGLPLGAELRVALGVESEERVWLRARGTCTILLERRRKGELELPADRELALCVDVRAFPLPDVFNWIQAAGKSGLLLFTHDDHTKSVWVHRGELVFAASNQRIDRLGHSLVRAGAITLEQLREAERGFRRSERFGKTLVERGLLTPRELWTGLQRKVEEIVRSLFSYPAGVAYFWDGELQPDNVVRLHLSTRQLVTEGVRWREELRRFVAALADPRVRIEAVVARRESTSGIERLLVDALAEESAFIPLCRRVGLDEPTAARMLQLLHRAGAVRIRRAQDDPDSTQRVRRGAPGDALRQHIEECVELLATLMLPIVAAEGDAAPRERFAKAIEEVATRYPGLLAGVAPGAGAALDSAVLVARGLELPEGSADDVHDALAALVDYLEFELKNHPGVRGADAVLESVAPLRARLRA